MNNFPRSAYSLSFDHNGALNKLKCRYDKCLNFLNYPYGNLQFKSAETGFSDYCNAILLSFKLLYSSFRVIFGVEQRYQLTHQVLDGKFKIYKIENAKKM